MVTPSYSSDLSKELRDVLKYPTGSANLILPDVTPVINVNPKHSKTCQIVRHIGNATSGVHTVYTTPADRDFYLCGVSSNFIKDAACDAATGAQGVACYPAEDGAQRFLIIFPFITLTAQSQAQAIDFNRPIKIARNTAITTTGSWAAGVCVRGTCIWGYVDDTSNA